MPNDRDGLKGSITPAGSDDRDVVTGTPAVDDGARVLEQIQPSRQRQRPRPHIPS